jgi:hypothetical protein
MSTTESSRNRSPLIAETILPCEPFATAPDAARALENVFLVGTACRLSLAEEAYGLSHELGHGHMPSRRLAIEPGLVLLVESNDRSHGASLALHDIVLSETI